MCRQVLIRTIGIVILHLIPTDSFLILRDMFDELSVKTEMYNALPWEPLGLKKLLFTDVDENHLNDIPVVRIDTFYPPSFDPCDEKTFNLNSINIDPLIYKIENFTGFNLTNIPWIALMDSHSLEAECWIQSRAHLIYGSYIALAAQNLGASAAILSTSGQPALSKVIIPPDVEINDHLVKGERVQIPLFSVGPSNEKLKRDYFLQSTNINSSEDTCVQWLMHFTSTIDDNLFDGPVLSPLSFYGITMKVIGLGSIGLATYILLHVSVVAEYYANKDDKASVLAFRMRLLLIIPELLVCFFRFIYTADPLGIYYFFDFFTARMILNTVSAMSTFTDIVLIYFVLDVCYAFKSLGEPHSNRTRQATFLQKYFKGTSIILFSAFIMVGVDQIVLYLGLNGHLGTSVVSVSVIYIIVVRFSVVCVLCKVIHAMKKEVCKTLILLDAPDGGGSTSKANELKQKAIALLNMRKYVVWAMIGRSFTILSLILIASRWYYMNPVTYIATFFLLMGGSTFSSIAQVLACLQLPNYGENRAQPGAASNLPGHTCSNHPPKTFLKNIIIKLNQGRNQEGA